MVLFLIDMGYLRLFSDEELEILFQDLEFSGEFLKDPDLAMRIFLNYLYKESSQNGTVKHMGSWGKVFMKECQKIKEITYMKIRCCRLTLNEVLPMCSFIERLDLSIGFFDPWDNQDISFIGNLVHLKYLYLRNNFVKNLPDSIGNLVSLRQLVLSNNGLQNLPKSIGNLISLEVLNLQSNGIKKLPKSTGNLTSLKFLNLWKNNLETLPESIGNLTSLEKLDLRYNRIEHLPKSIGKLKKLQRLDLRNNPITELPNDILYLPSLKYIFLPLRLKNTEVPKKLVEKAGVGVRFGMC